MNAISHSLQASCSSLRALPLFYLSSLLLCFSPASAAIMWEATSSTDAYSGGTALNFIADPSINATAPSFTGIEVTATASQDGAKFYANGTANGQLQFVTSSTIAKGESITFTFDFNMQLGSDVRLYDTISGRTRAAALFRVNPNDTSYTVDGTATIGMTGGNAPLQSYLGTPTVGDQEFNNSNIAAYNMSNDGSIANVHHRASFLEYSDADTIVFSEAIGTDADTSQLGVGITDPVRNSDFSFQSWKYTFTNESTEALPIGASFIFTFAGQNNEAQLALIPEPSSGLLTMLVTLVFLTQRRKRSS